MTILKKNNTDDKYLKQMLRVNHAGEVGAGMIYKGQLAVFRNSKITQVLEHMASQEKEHLEFFESELVKRNIRPSALYNIWRSGGYALGVITALLGEKAAMACTVAVEEIIDEHYKEQLSQISDGNIELKKSIEKIRQDELDHIDIATESNPKSTPIYGILKFSIQLLCKFSIEVAKKI